MGAMKVYIETSPPWIGHEVLWVWEVIVAYNIIMGFIFFSINKIYFKMYAAISNVCTLPVHGYVSMT